MLSRTFVAKTYLLNVKLLLPQNSKPQISSLSPPLPLSPSLPPSMDTFSSSVSTFKVPSLPQTYREFHHFKSHPYASPSPQAQAQAQAHAQTHISSTSKPNLIPKTRPFSHKNPPSLVFSSPPSPPNPIFYTKPATGYAAAIIDVAQGSDSLHLVQRDVHRLLGFLENVSFEDSAMARVVLEKGGFHRHVVALVKMLVKKNKSGIVREVLEEFERIYDELCGWVSSDTKMEEDQLFGIKVRYLVHV